jgi:ATP-dependent Lhr-like helicase
LIDISRIALLLARARHNIVHVRLARVSPLAVPVLLEIGREQVAGGSGEEFLLAEAEALVAEAMSASVIDEKLNHGSPGQNMLVHAP